MQRRSVLAALGGSLSVTGCLARGDGDEATQTGTPGRRYQECSREVIPYGQFPADVQAEINAALDGGYEAERVYLRDAMDVTASYVAVADAYYDPTITSDDDSEVLALHRVEPKALPSARPLSVEHDLDGERTIMVEVVDDDGTVLIDSTRDLWPGGEVEFGRTARVGTHEFRLTVVDDDEVETDVTRPVRIDESRFSVLLIIESDDIRVGGAVADLVTCQYES